jgi:hypothetical protein
MILKLTKYTNTRGTFEAEWIEGGNTVRVIAYSGDQVALFRADVAQYGGEIDEALLAEIQSEWVPPPFPPVPVITSVTMRQARLALLQQGLLTQVNDAVASMPGAQGEAMRIEWEFSSTVERNRPLVQSLSASLGLTSQQIDDLFALAATL